MLEITECKNVERSFIYDKYIHIIDPFKAIRRFKAGKPNPHQRRVVGRLEQLYPGEYILEFKILEQELLDKFKEVVIGEVFLLDRYMIEWESGEYCLHKYKSKIHKIENDLVVLRDVILLKIIDAVALKRRDKLKILLG